MNPSQLPHIMDELNWSKRTAKWGGKDYSRAIWVKDGYAVHRGRVKGPDGYDYRVDDQPKTPRFELVEAA